MASSSSAPATTTAASSSANEDIPLVVDEDVLIDKDNLMEAWLQIVWREGGGLGAPSSLDGNKRV